MYFGSNEMLELLMMAREKNFNDAYTSMELSECLKTYTYSKINKGFAKHEIKPNSPEIFACSVEPDEYDDVVSEVKIKVLDHLGVFLDNAEKNKYSVAQRQFWLKEKVFYCLLNYLKKREKTFNPAANPDDCDKIRDNHNLNDSLYFSDTMRRIVTLACNVNGKPEKILAYILNKVIFSELMQTNLNGVSTRVSTLMDGKTIFEIKNIVLDCIQKMYDIHLYDELKPIIDKVGDDAASDLGKKICHVTANDISNWTNRMKDHMMLHKAEFLCRM